MCVYIYIYICTHTHTYTHIFTAVFNIIKSVELETFLL